MLAALGISIGALLIGCDRTSNSPAVAVPGGDPTRGVRALQSYSCGSCHGIPNVPGANAKVGPPLTNWAERRYIAGELPNTPESLVRWIMNPEAIEPGTAMPNMGVSEADARDIAAYLYTLR